MSADVVVDVAAVKALAGPSGPVVEDLRAAARVELAAARRRAPVKTGRLRAGIELREGVDKDGFYVDVVTAAKRRGGYAYGTAQEIRRPYLRPIR